MTPQPVRLFHNLMPTMEAQYQIAVDLCLSEGGNLEHKWRELKMQHDGGPCPLCKTPFRVRVGGNFPKARDRVDVFYYFMPACHCFHVCSRCGDVMIAERFEGITWCRNCSLPPAEKRRRKVGDSRRSGKDAAAGDGAKEGSE